MTAGHLPPNFIPHIDGLRAVAVLSVVIYHLNPDWIPGGFAGVDVFFVISGYVISASLGSRSHPSFLNYVTGFYSRRMIRLLPALLVCLLVTGIFMTLFVPHIWRGEAARLFGTSQLTSIAAAFGLSNFLLVARGDNYFGNTAELNPFTHTWSLGVEEQFYFVFPLVFFFWVRAGATSADRRLSVVLLMAGATTSMLIAAWAAQNNSSFGFYLVFTRFWELAIGALLYQLHTSKTAILANRIRIPLLLVAVAALLVGFMFASPQDFPYPWALLPVLGTAGVIASLHNHPQSSAAKVLGSTPMLFFGRTSYSLYLWHWPVFVLFRWTTGIETWPHQVLALTTAMILMLISYRLVENPMRRSIWVRGATAGQLLLAGIAAMSVTASLLAGTYALGDRLTLSVTGNSALWYSQAKPFDTLGGPCGVNTVTNDFVSGKRTELRSSCPMSKETERPIRLFVLGDSHAGSYSTMLATVASRSKMHISLLSKGGCDPTKQLLRQPIRTSGCTQFAKAALAALIEEVRPGSIVFLSSFRLVELQRKIRGQEKNSAPRETNLERAEAMSALLKPLEAAGAAIIIEAPKPVVGKPLFRCSDWFNKNNPVCEKTTSVTRVVVEQYRKPVLTEYRHTQESMERLQIWDPLPELCDAEQCKGYFDNSPLFMDHNHISGHGNAQLVESFEGAIHKEVIRGSE